MGRVSACASDPVAPSAGPPPHRLLVIKWQRGNDLPVGLEQVGVAAVETINRPVGPEHAAIGTEQLDRLTDPRLHTAHRPMVINGAEAGDLGLHVPLDREPLHAATPAAEVLE